MQQFETEYETIRGNLQPLCEMVIFMVIYINDCFSVAPKVELEPIGGSVDIIQ